MTEPSLLKGDEKLIHRLSSGNIRQVRMVSISKISQLNAKLSALYLILIYFLYSSAATRITLSEEK